MRKVLSEKLQLDHLRIELDWAHRTGKTMTSSEKRVVRFPRLKDRLAVLDKLKT